VTPDRIGLVIGGVALALLIAVVVATIVHPSAGKRLRRYNEQRTALRDFLAAAPGGSLELDWATYGEVPKQEVILLAGKHSWQFADDELTDSAWVLRFTKSP
jgi:hypothetical protein